jgi:hypothetical protein
MHTQADKRTVTTRDPTSLRHPPLGWREGGSALLRPSATSPPPEGSSREKTARLPGMAEAGHLRPARSRAPDAEGVLRQPRCPSSRRQWCFPPPSQDPGMGVLDPLLNHPPREIPALFAPFSCSLPTPHLLHGCCRRRPSALGSCV